MFKDIFENVRKNRPLIHNVTNYVTVNDCANILLACGASPIMADEKEEVAEITSMCAGLNINIGTLNSRTIELPEGQRKILSVLEGGAGTGEIKLYKHIGNTLEQIEHATLAKVFCEFGHIEEGEF